MATPAFGYTNLASYQPVTGSQLISTAGLYSSTVKCAGRITAATANAITHVRFAARVGTGTQPTYKVSIQGVDANGLPDGSIKASGNANGTFTASGTAFSVYEVALGSSYTPSVGELISVVFEYNSGTIGNSNYAEVLYGITKAVESHNRAALFDYGYGGGYGVTANADPTFIVKTATERYGGMIPSIAQYDSTYAPTAKATTTSGNRVAAKVVMPSASYLTSVNVSGFSIYGTISTGQSVKLGIWNAAGTALASQTIDTDAIGNLSVEFSSPLSVSPGDTIYCGIESVSSSSASLFVLDFASTSDRDATWSVFSQGSIVYSSWNGSAWSDSSTDVPMIQVYISGVTGAGGGSSGLMYRRTFDGGIA